MQRRSSFPFMELLDLEEAYGFIMYLYKKEHDEKLFFRWAVGYQDQMSYDDFIQGVTPAKELTEEEILADQEDILRNYKF